MIYKKGGGTQAEVFYVLYASIHVLLEIWTKNVSEQFVLLKKQRFYTYAARVDIPTHLILWFCSFNIFTCIWCVLYLGNGERWGNIAKGNVHTKIIL